MSEDTPNFDRERAFIKEYEQLCKKHEFVVYELYHNLEVMQATTEEIESQIKELKYHSIELCGGVCDEPNRAS